MKEFVIFSRVCECKFYHNFDGDIKVDEAHKRQKYMGGLIMALLSFSRQLSKNAPEEEDKSIDQVLCMQARKEFKSFTTPLYKMHLYESPTGIKFVLITAKTLKDYCPLLKEVYTLLYVKHVSTNYLHAIGDPITSEFFKEKVKDLLLKNQ